MRIPKEIAREINISEGSAVSFSVENGAIVLSTPKKLKYTIEELVKGITRENMHELVDWGPDVGNEILPPWEN